MKDIFQIISKDEDLRKLLMEAFKFEGCPFSVAAEISEMRAILWERYKIDIEILC